MSLMAIVVRSHRHGGLKYRKYLCSGAFTFWWGFGSSKANDAAPAPLN
jgi:hypothetical protein